MLNNLIATAIVVCATHHVKRKMVILVGFFYPPAPPISLHSPRGTASHPGNGDSAFPGKLVACEATKTVKTYVRGVDK